MDFPFHGEHYSEDDGALDPAQGTARGCGLSLITWLVIASLVVVVYFVLPS